MGIHLEAEPFDTEQEGRGVRGRPTGRPDEARLPSAVDRPDEAGSQAEGARQVEGVQPPGTSVVVGQQILDIAPQHPAFPGHLANAAGLVPHGPTVGTWGLVQPPPQVVQQLAVHLAPTHAHALPSRTRG